MKPVIETYELTKRYGRTRGIDDLSFAVGEGEVFGFLGPNGAGKTTTIRTLLDLIRPTSGRATIFGLDSHVASRRIRRETGYLPGDLVLYPRMTGGEFLRFGARMRDGAGDAAIEPLAERLRVDLDVAAGELSHGNRQKIGLIQAFMHRPRLLVLDEPTLGLDPLVQREFHAMVREAVGDGATVFLSSHVLSEVELICARVGIVREGRLVATDDVGALKARARRRVEIHFDRPVDAALFARLAGVSNVEATGDVVRCEVTGPVDALVKAAARHTVIGFTSHEPSLEDAFLSYYEGSGHADGVAPKDAA